MGIATQDERPPAGSNPTGVTLTLVGMARGAKRAIGKDDLRRPRLHPSSPSSAAAGRSKAGKSKTGKVAELSLVSLGRDRKAHQARRPNRDVGEIAVGEGGQLPYRSRGSRSDEKKHIKPAGQIALNRKGVEGARPGYVKLADRNGIVLSETSDSRAEAIDETQVADLVRITGREEVDRYLNKPTDWGKDVGEALFRAFGALADYANTACKGDEFVSFPDNSKKKAAIDSLYLGDVEREAREDCAAVGTRAGEEEPREWHNELCTEEFEPEEASSLYEDEDAKSESLTISYRRCGDRNRTYLGDAQWKARTKRAKQDIDKYLSMEQEAHEETRSPGTRAGQAFRCG